MEKEEEIKESEKLLIIEEEMRKYNKILCAASKKILDSKATAYPIFIASKQELNLGIPIIDRIRNSSNWAINASSLEEFVTNELVFKQKVNEFKKTYKSPEENLCLFVLSDLGAQFLFVPRLL